MLFYFITNLKVNVIVKFEKSRFIPSLKKVNVVKVVKLHRRFDCCLHSTHDDDDELRLHLLLNDHGLYQVQNFVSQIVQFELLITTSSQNWNDRLRWI